MKASEFVAQIQALIAEHGDRIIVTYDGYNDLHDTDVCASLAEPKRYMRWTIGEPPEESFFIVGPEHFYGNK